MIDFTWVSMLVQVVVVPMVMICFQVLLLYFNMFLLEKSGSYKSVMGLLWLILTLTMFSAIMGIFSVFNCVSALSIVCLCLMLIQLLININFMLEKYNSNQDKRRYK